MGWYDNQRMGLFIHWGCNTENPDWEKKIQKYNNQQFEDAVLAAGWNAKKWIDYAKQLNAGYITLAIFHSCLGYIKAWKSQIPGTYTTKHDFLGELIEEGNKENIKIVVYISGDPFSEKFFENDPWIKKEEYAKYKNDDSIDMTDLRTWQTVYCKEVIAEILKNYPDVGGFWFDGWNEPDICADLFGFIHSINPDAMNIRNDFHDAPFKNEDVMSIESFAKVYEPTFDYPSSAWLSAGNNRECCYVMPELSDWWTYLPPAKTYNKQDLIRKMVTITANGWVAKMGIGPELSGDYSPQAASFISDVEKFYTYAKESVFDTTPGGFAQCYYNDGAYGVSTMREDKNEYYLHLLLPPRGDKLIIGDGGLEIESAVNLYDKSAVDFTVKNGEITFTADFKKYTDIDGDMIIKMIAKKKDRHVFDVTSTGEALPCNITVDMGQEKEVSSIILQEVDDSAVTFGGWAAPENNRLKCYEVAISQDGITYDVIQKGVLKGVRGQKQINFAPISARYLRLSAVTAQNTSGGYMKRQGGMDAAWSYVQGAISYITCVYGADLFVDNFNTLWRERNAVKVKIADKVKKVFKGFDDEIYYITTTNEVMKYPDIATGIRAARAAVDKEGNIHYMRGNNVYCAENLICENVNDLAFSKDNKLCVCGDKFVRIGDDTWPVAYNVMALTADANVNIMDDRGAVYGLNGHGGNPYRICNNAADIQTDYNGRLYVNIGATTGRLKLIKLEIL